MNSPSSNKAKKPLNSNSDNNLINISNLNPFNNFTTEANFLNNNNNKSNKKSSKENTKKEEIFPSLLNKNEKNGQLSPNISSAIILTVLNSANNLNNISNLNNALNIQNNPNFLSTINDLNQGSQQSEENIEFSSKNICSTANLFYNQKDSANNNNSVGIAKQAFNFMKNQTILDQFNIKAFANPAVYSRNNDRKINAFFNKTATSSAVSANLNSVNSNSNSIINNNNLNINNNNNNNNSFAANAATEDKSIKLLKQNYLKLLEDNEKLVKDLGDKNRFIIEKEKESEKLKLIFLENEQSLKSLCMLNKSFESQINLGKNSLIKYLKEFEELKKTQNKIWLNEQAYRLGKFSIQRMGHRVIEAWEDGEEIKNVKNTVKQIKENKEDLEKLKKRLAAVIKKKEANLNKMEKDNKELNSNINNKESSNNNNNNNKEAFGFYNNNININGLSMGLNAIAASNANGFLHPMNIFHSSNLFGYAHNGNLEEYTEHEMLELKELINFKLARLNKEETECLEKLEKLEIEKIKYQIEFKRNMEEEKCRYGSNSKEKWPVLSNRYLILSLLGRGGYSEVYKVILN
jgi:tousled-like kinase